MAGVNMEGIRKGLYQPDDLKWLVYVCVCIYMYIYVCCMCVCAYIYYGEVER